MPANSTEPGNSNSIKSIGNDNSKSHFITMAQRMARSESNHNAEHIKLASMASQIGKGGQTDLLPSGAAGKRARPRAAPFTTTTLLSKNGFRYLRKLYSSKLEAQLQQQQDPKDPVKDLDRIICLYKEWADVVCPKYVFLDVIDKIERLCKTSSMKSYLMALKRGDESFDEIQFMASKDADDVASILEKSSKLLQKENDIHSYNDNIDYDNNETYVMNYQNDVQQQEDSSHDEYDDVDQGDFGFAEEY